MRRYLRTYIPGGCFFFTVNLANRSSGHLVSNIVALRSAFLRTRTDHPFTVDAIVVLPDHLHTIWTLPDNDANYSVRWSLIKARFSRALANNDAVPASRRQKRERGIWQRRFYEHAIRDERDLENHINYIHWNPVKHGWAKKAGDWPYSSIHRHIREGRLEPEWVAVDHVQAMDLE